MELSTVGDSFEFTYRMVRSDGAIVWVKDIVSALEGEGGPMTLRGFLVDITKQKRFEEDLEAVEARYRRLIRESPDALLLVQPDGTILQCNAQAEVLFGISQEELRGSLVERLIPKRFADIHTKHRRGFAEAPKSRAMGEGLELLGRRFDGSEFPVRVSLSPIERKGGLEVIVSVRDLTAEKAIHFRLSETERLLRLMTEALPALIACVDRDQRYRYVNEHYANWFGHEPHHFENRSIREVLGEELYGRVRPWVKQALGGASVRYEMAFPSLDGSTCPVELTLIPLVEDGETISGYFVVIFDISDRERVKDADRLHREELAHVLRVATMGELASSIAHELNQPLAAIVTNAQAADRFLGATPPNISEVKGALEDICEDGKRASDVIRRMRDLLRREVHREEVLDVVSLITETVEMLRSDSISRNVSVTVNLASDLPPAFGDPVQLKQVILNLMMNAFEVTLPQEGEQVELTIATSLSEGGIEVTFSDNGPGFPDDSAETLFTPFMSSKPDGLGMGLTISRTIIEAHGGELSAESNGDRGATFRILLPVGSDVGE